MQSESNSPVVIAPSKHPPRSSLKQGKYRFNSPAEQAEWERKRDDKQLLDLRGEIALLNMMVQRIVQADGAACLECMRLPISAVKEVTGLVDSIGKLVKQLDEMENGKRVTLTRELVSVELRRVVEVVVEYVPERERQVEMARRIGQIVGGVGVGELVQERAAREESDGTD